MRLALVVLAVALFSIFGCSKLEGPSSEYALKVADKTISVQEFKNELDSLPPQAKNFFQGTEGLTKLAEEVAKKEMLYMEAKKRGLESSQEYQKKLAEFQKITLINIMLEKEIEASQKVSEAEAKDYYDKNPDEFINPTHVRLSQIVLNKEQDVEKVYARLQSKEDFGSIASEMSIDKASAKAKGDIGFIKKEDLKPEMQRAIMQLKKGDVSMPIKIGNNIHILKITDIKGTTIPFDIVKGQLIQNLTMKKQREAFNKLLDNITKNYKVDINTQALAKLAGQKPDNTSGSK